MGDELFNVVHVRTPDGEQNYVTLLPPDATFSDGLAREAIVGRLLPSWKPGQPFSPESFVANPAFVQVMHLVIARESPESPTCRAEARRNGAGFLYVIDQRTATPNAGVPPEDIVGAFEVKGGMVATASYRPNSKHLLLSARGFFRLGPQLQACLVQEVMARNRQTP
jgi:hypothetical protein